MSLGEPYTREELAWFRRISACPTCGILVGLPGHTATCFAPKLLATLDSRDALLREAKVAAETIIETTRESGYGPAYIANRTATQLLAKLASTLGESTEREKPR